MQLFYNPELDKESTDINFTKEESRHIVKVLRKKENDIVTITNGKGLLFYAKINFANDKKCSAIISKIEFKEKTWNYYLHVAIAPTKNNDRLEWFLEKATEIGIDEITPIICANSERKNIKEERLEKIILSAMKQSLKYNVPKLNKAIKFSEFINKEIQGNIYIAHCEEGEKKPLKEIPLNSKYTILIGPEGDFTTKEIEDTIAKKATPITLGNSRLRTETAGIVAVQNVSFINS